MGAQGTCSASYSAWTLRNKSRPVWNDAVAKLPRLSRETRGLSRGRVDDVEATRHRIDAVEATASTCEAHFPRWITDRTSPAVFRSRS